MAGKDLEEALLEAAEIAKKLPGNLQEAGFNRAADELLGKARRVSGQRRSGAAGRDGAGKTADARDVSGLVEAIDRTAYPNVGATRRVGDRALKVLQLADQDHGVGGLTPSEIATILSQKFRLPTKANSVLKALGRETETVGVRSGPCQPTFQPRARYNGGRNLSTIDGYEADQLPRRCAIFGLRATAIADKARISSLTRR